MVSRPSQPHTFPGPLWLSLNSATFCSPPLPPFLFSRDLIRFKKLPQGSVQSLVNTYPEVKLLVLVLLEGIGKTRLDTEDCLAAEPEFKRAWDRGAEQGPCLGPH